jgi:hypothetical protein
MQEILDVLDLIEAAYRVGETDDDWMRQLVEASEPVLGRGLGATGYFVDASAADSFRTWAFQCTGLDGVDERQRFARWSELAPTALKRHAHLHAVTSFASQIGDVAPRAFSQSFELTGRADMLGISALDGSARGCALALPCRERQVDPPDAEQILIWERVAAHIAAALRLRRGSAADGAAAAPGDLAVRVAGERERGDLGLRGSQVLGEQHERIVGLLGVDRVAKHHQFLAAMLEHRRAEVGGRLELSAPAHVVSLFAREPELRSASARSHTRASDDCVLASHWIRGS